RERSPVHELGEVDAEVEALPAELDEGRHLPVVVRLHDEAYGDAKPEPGNEFQVFEQHGEVTAAPVDRVSLGRRSIDRDLGGADEWMDPFKARPVLLRPQEGVGVKVDVIEVRVVRGIEAAEQVSEARGGEGVAGAGDPQALRTGEHLADEPLLNLQ